MIWFALFLLAVLAGAAYRVSLSVRIVRAQRAGDTATQERLAARAFRFRVGILGLTLLAVVAALVAALVVGLLAH